MSSRLTGRSVPPGLGPTTLRRWPASALALRAVMVLAPPGAVLVSAAAGDAPPVSVLVVVALFSFGFAARPESGFGILALGAPIVWWCRVGDDGLHASVLVAAVLVVVAHVAGLVAAYGPSGARVEAVVGSVWVARAATVLLASPVVWLLARVARRSEPDAALWQAGLLTALLAVVAVVVRLQDATRGER